MSTGTSAYLAELDRDREAVVRLREKYPDAELLVLPDGRRAWSSATIEPTGFMFIVVKSTVLMIPYEDVSGVHIVAPSGAWRTPHDVFDSLPEEITRGILAHWTNA